MMIYLSYQHMDAQITLDEYITDRVGPDWTVCRSTKRNRERYANRITPGAYAHLKREWSERRVAAWQFLGWSAEA